MLTGMLHRLGAGEPKTQFEPGPPNPKGYAESAALQTVHNEILAAAGTGWSDWSPFNPDWQESMTAGPFMTRLSSVLADEFGANPLVALKDPRVCRFAEFYIKWLTASGVRPLPLIAFRNPLEVAASLNRRDGMTTGHAMLLWLRHVLDAESATRDITRSFVNYHDVLDDWRAVASGIRTKFAVRWPRYSPDVELEIDRWVDRGLRRETASDQAVLQRSDVSEWVRETYRCLVKVSAEGESPEILRTLSRIREEFDRASGVFGTLARAQDLKLSRNRDEIREITSGLTLAQDEAVAAAAAAASLRLDLSAVIEQAKGAEARADALSGQLANAAIQQKEAEESITSYAAAAARDQAQIRSLQGELEALRRQLSEHQGRAARLESEGSDLRSSLVAQKSAADAADAQRLQLQTSLAEARESFRAVFSQIEELTGKHAKARSQAEDAGARVKSLTDELLLARGQLDRSTVDCDALRSALATEAGKSGRAQSRSAELEAELLRVRSEATGLQHRVAQLSDGLALAEASADKAKKTIDGLRNEIATATETIHEASTNLKARAGEIASLQTTISSLEERGRQADCERAGLQELVATANARIEELGRERDIALGAKDLEIARLTSELANGSVQAEELQARIDALIVRHRDEFEALAVQAAQQRDESHQFEQVRLQEALDHESRLASHYHAQSVDLDKALRAAGDRIASLESSVQTLHRASLARRQVEQENSGPLEPDTAKSTQLVEQLLRDHSFFTTAGPEFEEFNPNLLRPSQSKDVSPLLLAYYLPQFHPTDENDEFWGRGFTEWRQLPRALSRFPGHYQPRIPRDLGFYDLRDADAIKRQAELAKAAGIGGFCYYYYWFNGRRVLHRPLELFLDSDIEMPFALMWANENWTRAWDGGDTQVLLRQDYLPEDEDALLADFVRHFRDRRYIQIDGRPLFIIYNPRSIPDPTTTIQRWRDRLRLEHGLNPLLYMAQTFGVNDPRPFGLDGAIEFPPHKLSQNSPGRPTPEAYSPEFASRVIEYDEFARVSLEEETSDFPVIKTIVPSWDNDPRKPNRGLLLEGISPKKYEAWLRALIVKSLETPAHGASIVAINAWNEWAESAYLEPDVHFGAAYLNATARAYSAAVSEFDVRRRNSVSVIVPNYNHAPFLEERLRSIIEQSLAPAEIIFLDDASTDDSVSVARRVLGGSSVPYRIVVNDRNSGGVFRQWIKGLGLAQSELIWIAESDDTADRDFLKNIVPLFGREDVMAAYGRIAYVTEAGAPLDELDGYYDGLERFTWGASVTVPAFEAFTGDFAVKNIIPNASGLLFRKPTLSEAEVERLCEYGFAGDWYFYALVARGGSIAYSPAARSYFRQRRSSTSRSALFSERHLNEHRMILTDILREYGLSARTLDRHIENLLPSFESRTPDDVRRAITPPALSNQETPLRICIAAHSFAVGGGEVVPVVIANSLKARGHHVTYLVLERLAPGARSIRGRLRPDIPVVCWEDIPNPQAFVKSHGFDVFNSHNVSWEWRLACEHIDLNLPYVATLHGGYETVTDLLDQQFFIEYLQRTVGAWLYLAEKNHDLLMMKGIPSRLFHQTFNAIPDFHGAWADRTSFREHFGIPADAFVLVQCSRAIEEKGWKTSIDTVQRMARRSKRPVHLVLIGDGPYLAAAQELARDVPNVSFMGAVDEPVRFLRCCDLGIFPSSYSGESFPLFLLECFHAGLPVIASAIGEIPNLMGSSPPGAVVPLESSDAMAALMAQFGLRLANDRVLYGEMCARARAMSRHFSVDKLADRYVDTFRELIAAPEGGRQLLPGRIPA